MTDHGPVEIRAISEDELPAWEHAMLLGFLQPGAGDGEPTPYSSAHFEPGRWLAACVGGRIVGTLRSFDTELTVPGGATVPANAITCAAVLATHRRRGVLTRLMAHDTAAARRRGSVVSILAATEYPIYGRFGFGPATRRHGWTIDLRRARGLRPDLVERPGERVEFAGVDELRALAPALHDACRLAQPGSTTRDERWWRVHTGELGTPGVEHRDQFHAVSRDAAGTVTGLLTYHVNNTWDRNYPDCTLVVSDVLARDLPAAVCLWRFAFSVDWVHTVVVRNIAPDDPLPLLLGDPRAATPLPDNGDMMWLRILDPARALGARRFAASGRATFEVTGPDPGTACRWTLEVGPDGTGRCGSAVDEPDVALDAGVLGSLYLGGETVPRLAAAGLVKELRPGAVTRVDRLLRTALRPWNADPF